MARMIIMIRWLTDGARAQPRGASARVGVLPGGRPARGRTRARVLLELVLLDEANEIAARDLELLGGAGLVAAVALHRRADHPALECLDGGGQRVGLARVGVLARR